MRLNNNKGVTLISLAVTTLIIIVIAGAIIFNTRNQISLRDINYLYEDIQNIKAKVDNYYVTYGELPILCDYVEKDVLIDNIAMKADTLGASIAGGLITNPNDNDNYYVIELEKLGGITLNYGHGPDYQGVKDALSTNDMDTVFSKTKIYIINEKTHQIYFPHGIFADNIMYCTYKIDTEVPQINLPENRSSQIKEGDYVDYTYDVNTTGYTLEERYIGFGGNQVIEQTPDLKWRVLSINDDESIDLVSDQIADSTKVYINGSLGYSNGVLLLNNICKNLYSSSKYGSSITVRSINIDDIEKHYITDIKDNYEQELPDGTTVRYNQKKTNSVESFPDIYKYENGSGINTTIVKQDGIGQSENGYTVPTLNNAADGTGISLTATQTFYEISSATADMMTSEEIYNLIFGFDKKYWLASRNVSFYPNGSNYAVVFRLADVNKYKLSGEEMHRSQAWAGYPSVNSLEYYVRPVVHISPSVKIILREGTEEKMHKIEQ